MIGREWIEKEYLPLLDGSVLIVGVDKGTAHYPKLVKEPGKCVTIDNNPDRSVFGSPAGHIIEDFLLINDFAQYDNVSIYGLDGKYTPNEEASWLGWAKKLIRKADGVIPVGGTLLFGGNVESDWEEILSMPELEKYERLFYNVDKFGKGRINVKLWLRKVGSESAKEEITGSDGSL